MKKVALIYEDFTESSKAQAYLKKVGFDVLLQTHDQRISDLLMSFNPDIVIAFGVQKFSSLSIGLKLREIQSFKGKSVLVFPEGVRPSPMEFSKARVDVMIEAPVMPEKLIQIVCKMTNLDPQVVIDKFKKSKISEPMTAENQRAPSPSEEVANIMVRGGAFHHEKIAIEDRNRKEKYQKFIQEIQIDKKITSHSRTAIRARQLELKKGWDFNFLSEIDKLKQQFAQALFKK